MSDFVTTFLIIMSEAAAFFAVVIILVLIFKIRSNITSKRCAKLFVKRIKNGDPEHSEQLKNILLNDYGLDETQASSAVQSLIEQEHTLYSNIIKLYLSDKGGKLEDIGENVKNLTSVMHGVTFSGMQDNQETNPDGSVNSENGGYVQQLKDRLEKVEKEKLVVENELSEAMKKMQGMMTEFASMYAGGADGDDSKIRDELENSKNKQAAPEKEEKPDEKSDIDLNVEVPDLDIAEASNNKPEKQ